MEVPLWNGQWLDICAGRNIVNAFTSDGDRRSIAGVKFCQGWRGRLSEEIFFIYINTNKDILGVFLYQSLLALSPLNFNRMPKDPLFKKDPAKERKIKGGLNWP